VSALTHTIERTIEAMPQVRSLPARTRRSLVTCSVGLACSRRPECDPHSAFKGEQRVVVGSRIMHRNTDVRPQSSQGDERWSRRNLEGTSWEWVNPINTYAAASTPLGPEPHEATRRVFDRFAVAHAVGRAAAYEIDHTREQSRRSNQ
jgi:hypothetical protein